MFSIRLRSSFNASKKNNLDIAISGFVLRQQKSFSQFLIFLNINISKIFAIYPPKSI